MGLLQEFPDPKQIEGILSRITGDEGSGTGVAGVLGVLRGLDTAGIAGSLSVSLDGKVSGGIAIDTASLMGGVNERFDALLRSIPGNGHGLVGPISGSLDSLRALTGKGLSGNVLAGLDGLKQFESLIPADAYSLIAAAGDKLGALKSDLIGGEFGEVRDWAESVRKFAVEVKPIIDRGPDALTERLIAFLAGKGRDVVRTVLPSPTGLGAVAGDLLAQALTTSHVTDLRAATADLGAGLGRCRNEFEMGNFSNTLHLQEAEAAFARVSSLLGEIALRLRAVLAHDGGSAEALGRALDRQIVVFKDIEIIDVGNIKDKITAAIGRVEKLIAELDLGIVKQKVDELFAKLDTVLPAIDLQGVVTKVRDVQAQLQRVIESIDGVLLQVVAALRSAFTSVKQALHSMISALGTYDENGRFRFHIQAEIESFLKGLKTSLHDTIQPVIDQFTASLADGLRKVSGLLSSVQGEIDTVRQELQTALGGVAARLEEADVPGTMEQIRVKLDGMLSELGAIDLAIVVDPVIAQINEMRDQFKKIDLSSMNEVLLDGFKLSLNVVINLDFTGQITAALMTEFDALLDYPKRALKEVEDRVESAIKAVATLAPDALLKPLDTLFQPVTELLDAVKLERLLEPLNAWHERALAAIDSVSPSALLKPVIELHGKLEAAFDAISPSKLLQPVRGAVESLKAEIQGLDFSALTDALGAAIAAVRAAMDRISPERLFEPLIAAFDKVMKVLDDFSPGKLLEPMNELMASLLAPLASLTAPHIELIRTAFAPLIGLPSALDPRISFALMKGKTDAALRLLDELDVGRILVDLKAAFDPMQASFKAKAGPAEISLSARIEGINPLRAERFTQDIAALQAIRTDLAAAFPSAEPPAELMAAYQEIQERLQSLVPIWLKKLSTPEELRRAVELANPLNVAAEIDRVWDAVKQKVRLFDPRVLLEKLTATFDRIKNGILVLDPDVIGGAIRDTLAMLAARLDTLDLGMIEREAEGLVGEIRGLIGALDPSPIIADLDGLTNEVRQVLVALSPVTWLAALQKPFAEAQAIVKSFDPAAFREPLEVVFKRVEKVLVEIDVGVVLQPINDRLQQLRDDLKQNLDRTEQAFKGMVMAIPLSV